TGCKPEEDRHGGAVADREAAQHQGLPRVVCQGTAGLARFARLRAGDGLAHATGADVRKDRRAGIRTGAITTDLWLLGCWFLRCCLLRFSFLSSDGLVRPFVGSFQVSLPCLRIITFVLGPLAIQQI